MANITPLDITQSTVNVATTSTPLTGIIPLNGIAAEIEILMTNTGGTATNSLSLTKQYTPNGTLVPFLSNTDFGTATNGVLIDTSNGNSAGVSPPNAIAPGSAAFFRINVGPAVGFQLKATVASGSTTIVIGGSGRVYARAN